jgi:hypothetical protein
MLPRAAAHGHGAPRGPVVITAAGRTGSTLLQTAFAASCDALTFYEPCLHSPDGDVRQDRCADHVRRFLTCDLPQNRRRRWDPPAIRGWLKNPYRNVDSCPQPPFDSVERTAEACRDAKLRLVKEIRLVGQLHRLVFHLESIASRSTPVVLVQLIRDPRAMLASQKRLGWWRLPARDPARSHEVLGRVAKRMCRGMLADSRTGQRVSRRGAFVHALVRFEDLVANLTQAVERLHAEIGWRVPRQTREWLQRTARGHCSPRANASWGVGWRGNASWSPSPKQMEYSTCRNGTGASRTNWREHLTLREQKAIVKRCSTALRHFGYVARRNVTGHRQD